MKLKDLMFRLKNLLKKHTVLSIATALVVLLVLQFLFVWWIDLDLIELIGKVIDLIWKAIWGILINLSGLHSLCEYFEKNDENLFYLLSSCLFVLFCYILYRIEDNRRRKKNGNK